MISPSSCLRSSCSSPTRRMIAARSATVVDRFHSSCARCARAMASRRSSSLMGSNRLSVSPVAGLTTAYSSVLVMPRTLDSTALMTNIVISSGARTAVGSYGKSLKDVPPTQLGTIAAKAAMERASLEPENVDHVVFGNVIHTDTRDPYMARVVGIESGVPEEKPAYTVNQIGRASCRE